MDIESLSGDIFKKLHDLHVRSVPGIDLISQCHNPPLTRSGTAPIIVLPCFLVSNLFVLNSLGLKSRQWSEGRQGRDETRITRDVQSINPKAFIKYLSPPSLVAIL